ncbi:MAG TPA: hypothetical protein VF092_23745 [Longimicrobium sp.]
MKKLRLDLDALAVDSFDTHAPAGRRGTVMGNIDPDTVVVVNAGTLACSQNCLVADTAGGDTCDRRCEPSIVCPTTTPV